MVFLKKRVKIVGYWFLSFGIADQKAAIVALTKLLFMDARFTERAIKIDVTSDWLSGKKEISPVFGMIQRPHFVAFAL